MFDRYLGGRCRRDACVPCQASATDPIGPRCAASSRGILQVKVIEDATVGRNILLGCAIFRENYQAIEPESPRASGNGDPPSLLWHLHRYVSKVHQQFCGPRHDRSNSLVKYFWLLKTQSPNPENQLADYLNVQLKSNQELPDSLRAAIASHLYYMQANLLQEASEARSFQSFFGQPKKVSDIAKLYDRALSACRSTTSSTMRTKFVQRRVG